MIVGWQIVLSNNHTTLVNGKPVPFRDICDELVGEYPKSFKFRGWHPQCRCQMLPILANQEERKDLYRKIFDGKRQEWVELERNNPQEYKRQLEEMHPIVDRYRSEIGIDEEDDDYIDE